MKPWFSIGSVGLFARTYILLAIQVELPKDKLSMMKNPTILRIRGKGS